MLLFVCVALFISACSSDKKKSSHYEKYPVTHPIVMDTTYTKEYVADIFSIQHIAVMARVRGYIEKIYVDEGQSVKAGQVLFSINSREYEIALQNAKALLTSAIAEVKAAGLNLQNIKTLVEKNIVSKTELHIARTRMGVLHARVDETRALEASAELNLSYTMVRAPYDGIIDRIPNKIGSFVSEGTLLTTLSDNREVFAYFNMPEKEYLDFTKHLTSEKKNDVLLILANDQTHRYIGHIETVAGEVDNTTGNIAFRARFPNPELLLKNGSSGKVRIEEEEKNALIIPQKATFEIQDKIFVFTVDANDTIKMRSIIPKRRIPHLYIIKTGLSPDDRIIYEGIQQAKEGDKIIPEIISMKEIMAELSEE